MCKDYRENENLLRKLITQFFIFFIEFKLNLSEDTMNLQPANLLGKYEKTRRIFATSMSFQPEEDKELSPKKKVLEKYDQHNGIRTVVTVKQWISILTSGVVDAAWLNKELAHADEVAGIASWPSWRRLWHIQDLDFSDNDAVKNFWRDIEDIKENLKNGKLPKNW